jgi:hypothetical protein
MYYSGVTMAFCLCALKNILDKILGSERDKIYQVIKWELKKCEKICWSLVSVRVEEIVNSGEHCVIHMQPVRRDAGNSSLFQKEDIFFCHGTPIRL